MLVRLLQVLGCQRWRCNPAGLCRFYCWHFYITLETGPCSTAMCTNGARAGKCGCAGRPHKLL